MREALAQLGETGHVCNKEFLAPDGKMLTNIKIEADSGPAMGRHLQRCTAKRKPGIRSR